MEGGSPVYPAHHQQPGRIGAGEARLAGSGFAAPAAVRRQEQTEERENRERRDGKEIENRTEDKGVLKKKTCHAGMPRNQENADEADLRCTG